jgi:hypothetical protein
MMTCTSHLSSIRTTSAPIPRAPPVISAVRPVNTGNSASHSLAPTTEPVSVRLTRFVLTPHQHVFDDAARPHGVVHQLVFRLGQNQPHWLFRPPYRHYRDDYYYSATD